jgi:hypothetical protein
MKKSKNTSNGQIEREINTISNTSRGGFDKIRRTLIKITKKTYDSSNPVRTNQNRPSSRKWG